ncbi:MAG: hypothetical protein NW224_03330 [Leptolyngbyaceae cyanobacterium bins.302]|nr:hypothetical protein [Leptolyngbyaceae cyanobacterium bins.302]
MGKPMLILERNALRDAIHRLAEDAFHRHLISGHGDGEYADKYQIVYQGKPRHFSLSEAHRFLQNLVSKASDRR